MSGLEPTISGPEETYCLDTFELTAEVDGDPGYWSFEGPGNAFFNNINSLNTTVNVDEYGIYEWCPVFSSETMLELSAQIAFCL